MKIKSSKPVNKYSKTFGCCTSFFVRQHWKVHTIRFLYSCLVTVGLWRVETPRLRYIYVEVRVSVKFCSTKVTLYRSTYRIYCEPDKIQESETIGSLWSNCRSLKIEVRTKSGIETYDIFNRTSSNVLFWLASHSRPTVPPWLRVRNMTVKFGLTKTRIFY